MRCCEVALEHILGGGDNGELSRGPLPKERLGGQASPGGWDRVIE